MLSGENHDVRWIAAHERLKSYGCDQKAAAMLPASKQGGARKSETQASENASEYKK